MTDPMEEPETWVVSSTHHAPATGPRSWVPLLRKLRKHGWQHEHIGFFGAAEHIWTRNRHALNQQKLSFEETVASLDINGVSVSACGLDADLTDLMLLLFGAFKPAPPAEWRRSEAVDKAAKDALLKRAANDPTVDDEVFTILSRAIDGRPILDA